MVPFYSSGTMNVASTGNRNIGGTPHGKIIGSRLEGGNYYQGYGHGASKLYYNSATDDIRMNFCGKMESL
eukprot:UN13628